jgi:hypothetical protein
MERKLLMRSMHVSYRYQGEFPKRLLVRNLVNSGNLPLGYGLKLPENKGCGSNLQRSI